MNKQTVLKRKVYEASAMKAVRQLGGGAKAAVQFLQFWRPFLGIAVHRSKPFARIVLPIYEDHDTQGLKSMAQMLRASVKFASKLLFRKPRSDKHMPRGAA